MVGDKYVSMLIFITYNIKVPMFVTYAIAVVLLIVLLLNIFKSKIIRYIQNYNEQKRLQVVIHIAQYWDSETLNEENIKYCIKYMGHVYTKHPEVFLKLRILEEHKSFFNDEQYQILKSFILLNFK